MSGLITDLTAIGSIDRTADVLEIVDVSANASYKVTVNNLVGITGGSVVSTTDSQTVQNKTIDNTNTLTIKAANLVIQDGSDVTKQAKFIASGITAGQTRSYTLPDASTTLVGTGTTQTLTAKTLTSPAITGGTIDNSTITVDSISEHTADNGITVDGLNIKDGALNTNNSVVTTNITDAAVTPAKLVAGAGTGWAWQAWTPTYGSFTLGNGSVVAKYVQIGKTIQFRLFATLGTTSSVSGSLSFTLPANANADYNTNQGAIIGQVVFLQPGVVQWQGTCLVSDGAVNTANIYVTDASGAYAARKILSSNVPFTWGSGNIFMVTGQYEAA